MPISRFFALSAVVIVSFVSSELASAAARRTQCFNTESGARAWGDEKVKATDVFYINAGTILKLAHNPNTSVEELVERLGKPIKKTTNIYTSLSWFPLEASSFDLIRKYDVRVIDNQYCAVAFVDNFNLQIYITLDVHGEITYRQIIGEQAL